MNSSDQDYHKFSNQITDENRGAKNYNNPPIDNPSPYQTNQYMEPNNNANPAQNNPYANLNGEFADDLNQLRTKQKSKHCRAFTATVFLVGGVVIGNVLYANPANGLSLQALIGICAGSYLLYLIIGFCCNPLWSYLSNIDRGELFQTCYDQVRAKIGQFRFHAQCYHYETRHHTRHVTDSNGNSKTEHYTTTQKVVTHVATQYLNPIQTKDQSGSVDRIRADTNVVFIHFKVAYRFVDIVSNNNFNYAYQHFRIRHTFDVHQNFTMNYEIPGLVERRAFFIGNLGCNYKLWLILFGVVGLLWPYCLWVQSKIRRFDVNLMKVVRV